MVSQQDELYNRHNLTSIFIMALDAIRKAVTFHHTRMSVSQVEMMDNLKDSVCAKIRERPGGTLAIRARNATYDSAPGLDTYAVYRAPAAPGSRREEREKRKREKREARRQAGRERGDYLNTLTFFGYNTDATDDEEVTSTVDGPLASDAPRRKKRVRRSLIRRISYYPPRASHEPRQVVLHFLNLEEEGADFTAPINGEEFRQGDDDDGDTSGMESDFDEDADPPLPPQQPYVPAQSSLVEDAGAHSFSPTTATTHLVQALSVTDRYPLALPPRTDTVWTLGFGALTGAAPIVPDADAAAAAMWQATEAAWDTVPDPAPFVPQPIPNQVAPPPWPTSPEPAGGMPANAIFDLNAAAASMMRAPTPPPTIVPLGGPNQQRLVDELCVAMANSGSTPQHVVDAYLTERAAPGSPAGYARLRLPSERESFRQLHAIIERTLEIMARPTVAPAAPNLAPGPPMPPAPPASAPPSLAPDGPSSSTRVNVINLPGLGTHRIEQNGGGLPPTFTRRGRMKRQREAQAATAAVIAEAHAAAAAHAAREQQPMGDDTLVAGPSVSFDHDRRKARRLVDESPSSPCTPAPATSAPPVDEAPSNAAAPPLQRVLGAVVQHPSSAAAAAATASVHASSCPCVYCPSTHRPRTGIQTLAPPVSQTILGQQPLPAMSQAEMEQQRRLQAHQILIAQLQAQQLQHQQRMQSLAMLHPPPAPPPPPTQQSQQMQQSILHLLQQQPLRYAQPIDAGAAIRAAATTPPAALTPQAILDTSRHVLSAHRQHLAQQNVGPTLPRIDLPFYYSPMSFLSVAQPAAMPPPSFVDLPDANQVMSRQHMFNPATSSLSTAAAAALAAARSEVQRHGVEISQQTQTDQLLAQWISLDDANRQFHALLTGIPPGGEAAPIGAAQRDIDKYSVTQKWRAVEGADVDPCTVCMTDFEEGENVRKLTCNHSFHVNCIDPWLSYNKKCPNCRIDLDQAATVGSVAAPPAAPVASAAVTTEVIEDQLARVTRTLHAAAQQQLLNEMRIQQNEAVATAAAAQAEISFAAGLNTAPNTGPVMANAEL